jgi:hypothetical protein
MQSFRRVEPDRIPDNCVVVSLWRATGRTVADVVCKSSGNADDYIVAEFPRPVPIALQRAEELRHICGLDEVVIVLSDPSLWRADWGRLIEDEIEVISIRARATSA